ncbi:uncharacterized protein LOC108905698 isoform X2 [Anoplophora glabripennis]|uniref:uncharacterized protein LOC108905698 isoform X2 n=1 Tax=Anoplophora glabripennis TaxID=217634 RepID=UPI000874F841|nr:uncharacterized protein LOC108905698 isoform X2 [Anoplophora glabripennis]
MELTDDLVAIQGILINVIKITGEFTKINYKGGNEEKILKIIEQIQKHISSKNYVKGGKINSIVDKQVEDIVLFLAINTKYKKPLELADYDHLINIMPQLSKCVLANIVYGLDLCKYYCKVIEKLPINYGIELLEEIVPCLKKSVPNTQLRYAVMFLRAAVIKLSSDKISEKDEYDVFKLTEVTNMILLLLTGLHPGHVKNLKAVQIYQHMGYSLLSLFELLLYCDKENIILKQFIENVLRTACTLLQNVTINVYCSWAEVNEGEEPLQSVVAGKAYQVVEEYQKYNGAIELINMLGSIAKKPKTLAERIQAADTPTMIKKVHMKDQDQQAWFKAVLGTQIFNNEDAMKCVHTWAHLCDKDDVARLLKLSCQSGKDEAKQLAVKCASTLILQELILISTRHFYEHYFNVLVTDTDRVEAQLKLIFNKMNGQTDIDEDFIKDMCLLLLQGPGIVLKAVFFECIRNKCYIKCYEKLFAAIREIVTIKNFILDCLWQFILDNRPDANNVDNYIALFLKLQEMGYLRSNNIVNVLFLPLLSLLLNEMEFEQLGYVLQILLDCSFKIPANSEMTKVRCVLLIIMDECRCTFLELNVVKQQTTAYAVDIIKSLCEVHPNYDLENESHTPADKYKDEFTNYYKKFLSSKTDSTLLRSLYSDFSTENYADCVNRILQFLPRAVSSEWLNVMQEIFSLCGSEKAMELLTDVMILLCKVVETQAPDSNTGKQLIIALKYCLQLYGNALQSIQSDSTEAVEVDITKGVCRLLKHLPEALKEEVGLSIVNVLTQRTVAQRMAD